MTDYTELIRQLKTYEDGYGLYDDAAAAIEALMDAEKTYLAELAQCHENLRRAAETRREGDERIEALQAQLPKRGKWIWDDKRCIYVCSVCGSPKVRENMDRQIIKEQAYCYSCGAKMEVQE